MRGDERFWAKVDASGDCWIWTASRNLKGYGRLKVSRRVVLAHRFAYEVLVGPIPSGLTLDHLCRRRACVNPDHLEPVTSRENTRRSPRLQRMRQIDPLAAGRTCKHGHPFTPENTYYRSRSGGGRACRRCGVLKQQAYQQRRRTAV